MNDRFTRIKWLVGEEKFQKFHKQKFWFADLVEWVGLR